MNSFQKFNEGKLHCKDNFYISLNDECISDGEYI